MRSYTTPSSQIRLQFQLLTRVPVACVFPNKMPFFNCLKKKRKKSRVTFHICFRISRFNASNTTLVLIIKIPNFVLHLPHTASQGWPNFNSLFSQGPKKCVIYVFSPCTRLSRTASGDQWSFTPWFNVHLWCSLALSLNKH